MLYLKPRTPVDYFKVENPDEFQLFCISVADKLAPTLEEEIGLMKLSLFESDPMEVQDKVMGWLTEGRIEYHKPDEEPQSSSLDSDEAMSLPEDYCRKICLPSDVILPSYSFFIEYTRMDFLNSSMLLVVAATADFAMTSGLVATLNRELDNRELLFAQRCQVGEVACMPGLTSTSRRRIYYLVLRPTERHPLKEKAVQDCVYSLLCMARGQKEKCLAFPIVDKWRDPVPWPTWYRLLHDSFRYQHIGIKVLEYYYLTTP